MSGGGGAGKPRCWRGQGLRRSAVRGRTRGLGPRPARRAQRRTRGRELHIPRRPGGLRAQHWRRPSRASVLRDPGHPNTLPRPADRPGGATAVPFPSPGPARASRSAAPCQSSGRRSCSVCPKASGLRVECCSVAGLYVQPGSLRLPGLVQGHLARGGCALSLRRPRPGSLKSPLFGFLVNFGSPVHDFFGTSYLERCLQDRC